MRACQCVSFDQPVVINELQEPVAGTGDVKVKVLSAGIAYVDALTAAGLYQAKPPLPYIPGNEFAGVIETIGDGVGHLKVGDRVMGMGMSLLAEKAVVPAMGCVPIPDNVSDDVAGGLMISYTTALYALNTIAQLQTDERVLILGAAGAVGMAAIHIAKACGGRVIATASTPEKRQFCIDNGAEAAVDYTTDHWRDEIKSLTEGKGVDIVFDLVGGPSSEVALRCLAPGGRLVVVGFASGEIPRIPLNLPLLKRCSIVGADFGGHVRQQPEIAIPLVQQLVEFLAQGRIPLQPPEVFSLEQTQTAFDKIMARKTQGKVVVNPNL